MRLIRYFSICAFIIILAACTPNRAPVIDRATSSAASKKVSSHGYYVISRGDTLYSIAFSHGLDYKDVARWNGIGRGYDIFPGQKLRLRPPAARKPERQSTRTVKRSTVKKSSKQKNTPRIPAASDPRVKRWIWPTRGKIVRRYSSKDGGKTGIAIAGRLGQSIKASAAGKVVYSGVGILRYGKLIIIKHNETYFSAYAHNRDILVKEGQMVKQGQKIAEMGNSGTDRVILHFEIRKNGKPVNPLLFLRTG